MKRSKGLIKPNKQSDLVNAIADLDEEAVFSLVREKLVEGDDPGHIITGCQEGMRRVGERYEKQQYYLSGLIMAGEIFREVMELIRPAITSHRSDEIIGKVLLGTVKDDIHDLGKNIVYMLLRSQKITVYDIGVDVPPEEFLYRARELKPDIIGISALVTSAYDSLRETINVLRKGGLTVPIVIGGGLLTKEICQFAGADYWVRDAVDGLELCEHLLNESKKYTG